MQNSSFRVAQPGKQKAIVIGGGYAGLMAARVLADHFSEVLVVERNEFPHDANYRKGVPQAYHHHVLLRRGLLTLERLFPGFEQALTDLGAPSLDYGRDVQLHASDGVLPKFESGIALKPVRRSLIDHVLFMHLYQGSQYGNIEFVERCQVLGLRLTDGIDNPSVDSKKGRVLGVVAEQNGERRYFDSDLVVDCSGRASKLPSWLSEHNYNVPQEARVDAGISYASQLFRIGDSSEHARDSIERYCMDVAAKAPLLPKALGLWPVENGVWQLTCIAMNGEAAPDNQKSIELFAQSLGVENLQSFFAEAKAISPVRRHKGTAGVWRKYHQTRLPAGLLVLGDANCCFNPLHGQGMSVVASAVEMFEHCLAEQQGALTQAWAARVLKATRWVYWQAWSIALTEDLRWPSVKYQGLKGVTLLKWSHYFIDFLIRRGRYRPEIIQRCLRVTNMLQHPRALIGLPMQFDLLLSVVSKQTYTDPSANAFVASGDHPEVRAWIEQWGVQSSSYFGYQADCKFFVHRDYGCIAFSSRRVFGKSLNVMPTSPYCAPEDIVSLARALESFTGCANLFLGVSETAREALAAAGYGFSQIGREFQANLSDFEVAGKQMKYLRWAKNLAKRGFEVREQAWPEVDQKRVREISEHWRKSKRFSYRELAMLTRPPIFDAEWKVRKFYCYLNGRLVGYVFFDPYFHDGKIVGYCANILRSDPSVRPHGFLDLVVLEAIRIFRQEGIESVSLGMAPLYGVEEFDDDISSVRKTAQFIYRYGSFLYAFRALAYHKQRYRMCETPWYICYKDLSLPRVSYATARACRVV